MLIAKNWAWYNEIEEYAADWLENLIAAGLIAPGVVDRRSIEDVRADDLRGFRQCHFFAGIGVWSYALRRAGVSDDTPLWTGSAPCQPFSAAGKGTGMDDERHLWPHWFYLIGECRPRRVFGEQVASKDGLGWLDLVQADMEEADYSLWAVDTCSAGSGAPHLRQRLRFVAEDLRSADEGVGVSNREGRVSRGIGSPPMGQRDPADSRGCAERVEHASSHGREERGTEPSGRRAVSRRSAERLGHTEFEGLEGHARHGDDGYQPGRQHEDAARSVAETSWLGGLADDIYEQRQDRKPGVGDVDEARGWIEGSTEASGLRDDSRLADTHGADRSPERQQRGGQQRQQQEDGFNGFVGRIERPGPTNGFWRDADWLFCRDGKWRPAQPGTFPLVDGSAFRLGSGSSFEGKSRQAMLKGYGNAIDAEATCDFLEAYWHREEPAGDPDDALFGDLIN